MKSISKLKDLVNGPLRLVASNDRAWFIFNKLWLSIAKRALAARESCISHRLMEKLKQENMTVMAGPFAGMKYAALKSSGSSLIPKILGTYESELGPVIEVYIQKKLPLVIDVGCAEGYYAVGLALRIPEARVHAYDVCPEARLLCQNTAKINNVSDRIMIKGECTAQGLLQQNFPDGGLIICDCEGYELELFNEEVAAHLRNVHLLIELHDCKRDGVSEFIERTFLQTHNLNLVHGIDDPQRVRRYKSPIVSDTDAFERFQAFAERRREVMNWAVLNPKVA